jgi:hypothetical protein
MADQFGIQEQQRGSPEGDAVDLFQAAAPIINESFDIKVKFIYIPRIGTWVIVY